MWLSRSLPSSGGGWAASPTPASPGTFWWQSVKCWRRIPLSLDPWDIAAGLGTNFLNQLTSSCQYCLLNHFNVLIKKLETWWKLMLWIVDVSYMPEKFMSSVAYFDTAVAKSLLERTWPRASVMMVHLCCRTSCPVPSSPARKTLFCKS